MRSFKGLIVPLIIMILLVIGVIVYFVVSSYNPNETASTDPVTLLADPMEDLVSVGVNKKEPGAVSTSVLIKTEDSIGYDFEYDGEDKDSKAAYSSSKMSSFVSALISYYADYVSDAVSLSEYGLEDPEYTVVLTLKNGDVHKVNIGNLTPDSTKVYVKLDGDSKVYTVPAIKREYAAYKASDFLDSQILDLDYSMMSSVRFIRTSDGLDLKADVSFDNNDMAPSFHITSPVDIRSSSLFGTFIDYLAKLRITSYIDIAADDLRSYGLTEPAFKVIFLNKDGSEKKIYLSKNMAGYYYGYIDGTKDYFKISEYDLKLLDAPVLSYMEAYVMYFTASEVSSVKGVYGDESFEFSLAVKDDEAISDEHSIVELNGRNAKIVNNEGRSYCAMFFESLACMEIGGLEQDVQPVLSNPVCSITFITSNYQTYLLEFVKRGDGSYHVFINGEYSGFYVYDKVLFNNGGQDTYSYGVWEAYKLLNTAISENTSGVYNIPVDQ